MVHFLPVLFQIGISFSFNRLDCRMLKTDAGENIFLPSYLRQKSRVSHLFEFESVKLLCCGIIYYKSYKINYNW